MSKNILQALGKIDAALGGQVDDASNVIDALDQISERSKELKNSIDNIDASTVQQMEQIATEVENEALKAEGVTLGKQNGVEVESDSQYYHANTKYYSEQTQAIYDQAVAVKDSIPADYTALSDEVSDLKADLSEIVNEESVTMTFIEKATIGDNSTKFTDGGSNGGLYYMTVSTGDECTINFDKTQTRALYYAFSESIPTINGALTFLKKQTSSDEDYGTYTYTAEVDGYLSIAYYAASGKTPESASRRSGLVSDVARMESAITAINQQITALNTDLDGVQTDVDERIQYILNETGVPYDASHLSSLFEKGNVSYSANGWTYSSSNSRVRMKQEVTIHFPAGMFITLTDYTNAKFYLGWKNTNQEYKSQGWVGSDGYTTTEEGDYSILLCNKTEATVSDITSLTGLLRIYYSSGTGVIVDSLNSLAKNLNLFTKDDTIHGYIGANGSIETGYDANGTIRTDYIPVEPNTTYTIQHWLDTAHDLWCAVAEYNSGKTFIRRTTPVTKSSDTYLSLSFTTKATTSYVIVMYRAYREFAPLMFTKGTLLPAYLPSAEDIVNNIKVVKEKQFITGLNSPLMRSISSRIVAHRGDMYNAPENTVPAFALAGQGKVWGIETDIRETSDGEFVCLHDPDVGTMTDGTGLVANLTLEQIEALTVDAGANVQDYPNLKVATLDDYLKTCKRYNCIAVVELKAVSNSAYQKIMDTIVFYGMEGSTVFIVGSESSLQKVREITDIPVFLLYSSGDIDTTIATMKKYYDVWIDMEYSSITEAKIRKLHAAHIPIGGWTYTTKADAIAALESGVDLVTVQNFMTLDD